MSVSNEGREGIGFRRAGQGVGFFFKEVPEEKKPSEKNPYASVSHVLCSNKRGGKMCNKKVQHVEPRITCTSSATAAAVVFTAGSRTSTTIINSSEASF